jgi:hypothetical protein
MEELPVAFSLLHQHFLHLYFGNPQLTTRNSYPTSNDGNPQLATRNPQLAKLKNGRAPLAPSRFRTSHCLLPQHGNVAPVKEFYVVKEFDFDNVNEDARIDGLAVLAFAFPELDSV